MQTWPVRADAWTSEPAYDLTETTDAAGTADVRLKTFWFLHLDFPDQDVGLSEALNEHVYPLLDILSFRWPH
jgi:hypothetical protein